MWSWERRRLESGFKSDRSPLEADQAATHAGAWRHYKAVWKMRWSCWLYPLRCSLETTQQVPPLPLLVAHSLHSSWTFLHSLCSHQQRAEQMALDMLTCLRPYPSRLQLQIQQLPL